MLQSPTAKQKLYLTKRVNPILEKLVMELLIKQPEDITKYMIQWLEHHGDKIEKEIKQSLPQFIKARQGYEVESEEEDEDEMVEELMDQDDLKKMKQDWKLRGAVSTEAFGLFNKETVLKLKPSKKSNDSVKRMRSKLDQIFMFAFLDEVDQQYIIDIMEEKRFKPGDIITTQDDPADIFYIIDSGELDQSRRLNKNDSQNTLIKVLKDGDCFGELCLLYSTTRQYTITAKLPSVLFLLDRQAFYQILRASAFKKRDICLEYLLKVDLLTDLNQQERLQIVDSLKPIRFKKGEYIVKEGDFGETFYIVYQGEACAEKLIEIGQEPQIVFHYKQGDFFGEIALLKNQVRQASVYAKTDCLVACIERNAFNRLVGPLEEILRRNFARYEKYMN